MLLAAAITVAGCGSSEKKGTSASSDVLRIPYLADMSVPDPDVFYDIEGNSVILNQYEGLLKYAPSSTKIVGNLAKSWTVSPDRLTYTFTLQPNVTFHSGAALTSQAVKDAFQRRLDVDQAPAYMLGSVKSMSTPDDLTFVVRLKRPVNPFEAYMASSWGPKVIGPDAIKTNAGKDFGQTWLRTHGDGTGPYKLTQFDRGRQYTLTRNDDYWGTKANFKKVLIKITPDIGTQRLELLNGDLDAIVKSFPASELASLPDSLVVQKKDSNLRLLLYVNTNKAPFDDPAVRAGLRSTIDVDQLVDQAYAGTATKSVGAYPEAILADQPRTALRGRCREGEGGRRQGEHEEDHARLHGRRVRRPAPRRRAAAGQAQGGRLRRDAARGPAARHLRLHQAPRAGARTCCCRPTRPTPRTPTHGRGSSSTRRAG